MTTTTATLEVVLLVQGRPIRTWTSDDGVVTVGTGEGMTIRGGGADLLPHHATMHVEGGQVLVVAEGEAELDHNGEPVTFAVVRPDDTLRIGPLSLQARLRLPERRPRSRTSTSPVSSPRRQGPGPGARLSIRLPDGRARMVPLHEGRFVVGSGKVNLRLPGLETRHAEIVVARDRLTLRALDGAVDIGGRSVPKVLLRPGIVARLGEVEIWSEATATSVADAADRYSAASTAPGSPEREMKAVAKATPRLGDSRVFADPLLEDARDEATLSLKSVVLPSDDLGALPIRTGPTDPLLPMGPSEPTAALPTTADPTVSPPSAALVDSPPPSGERTAQLPPDVPKHPDDEDYDAEYDFVAPFDLAATIRTLPAPPESTGGPCVPAVVYVDADRVRDLGLLEEGDHVLGEDGPRCTVEHERVIVTWPDDARSVALSRGQAVVVALGERAWRISAVKAPRKPILPNLPGFVGYVLLMGVSTVLSMSAHGLLGIGVNAMATIGEPLDIEPVQEEQFAEVEMRLEHEVVQRREVLQLAEKAPVVNSQEVTRASQLPRSENTSVSSLLTRLAVPDGGSAGLEDAITNIDSVTAGSGSNTAFNLAGRLAAGSGVKVARSGTGVVNTAGQVGDGVGKLAAGARKGVRGKVTKLSSRMKVQGTLDPAEVTRVVNANMGKIQACYEREMTKNPGLAGRIQFDWTIATNGTVRGVRVQSSTMPSEVVANCISAEIKTWRFARPTGGEAVISYPFAFRSG